MVYVMADIHGQYAKYRRMLEQIAFSARDTLYILGDTVDRGPASAALLRDMSLRANVFVLIGNHDLLAAQLLRRLCAEVTEENYSTHFDAETLKLLALWQADGGQATLDSFRALAPEERAELLDYMEEFSPYEEIEVRGRRFVLVHGGIPYEKRHLPPEEQLLGELITERPDYTRRYLDGAYLVTGHTPTLHIGPAYRGRIYRGNGHIALDCGAGFGLPLGCIRLDDFREFYVE